jgi:hypothetical protein
MHKYNVGQVVQLLPGPYERQAARGSYTIIKQMPGESSDLEYRIKSVLEPHERVVKESQLLRLR